VAQTDKSGETSAALRWGTGERVDDPQRGSARVIAAARACYEESSVASTTIEAIAERAGVSRRTIYRYFDNKDAILLAVVEEQSQPFFDDMARSMAQFDNEDFRQLLIHCVLYAIQHGPGIEGHQLLMGQKNAAATERFYLRSPRLKNIFRQALETPFLQAQQAGEIDGSWQLDDLLNWVGRLIYSFIRNPEPIETINRMVTQLLLPIPARN
jgi:AcrR family transcriptional regulator